jgi:hypothetical protein
MLSHSSAKESHGFSRVATYAITFFGFGLGFAIFFRAQIVSGFDLLFGDRGDTRLVIFIHEHVFRAMLGRSDFLSPPFFYDFGKTLGFSDAFLLNQIIYAPLRGLGADSFLAFLLTIMTLSIAGYGFVYALLRRFGDVSVVTAVFSSFLFTFANNLYVNANHPQHFAIYYVPVITYFAIYAITEIHQHKIRSLMAGSIAGLLYGLLFPTGFYMAWFFGLGLLIFVPIFIFVSRHAVRAWFAAGPVQIGLLGLAFADGFLIGLIPLALIYIPVYKLAGSRHFSEYLLYAPMFTDIANVGANFVWADFFKKIGLVSDLRILGGGEQSIALTPGLQLLVILSLLIGLRTRYWDADKRSELTRAVIIAGAVVCITLFLVTIKIHEQSAFLVLFKLVPGAGAIRAGYRAMIVANYFAVISVALAIGHISLISSRYNASYLKAKFTRATVAVLMVLGVVEQVNLSEDSLVSRAFEHTYFDNVSAAPTECQSFYIASEPGQPPPIVQIDAALVAQKVGIPTINGYSGFDPPGWDFFDSTDANYEQNARAWAVHRGIDAGLCRFDMANGTFASGH